MLKIAVEANVELWDVDYHILLQTVVERSEVQGKVKSAIELLNMMALHHPVMGRLNAEMIQTIVGGTVVRISEDGHCGGCAQRLRSFDLSQEERAVLVRDVVEKLVTPRVICQSHYEPLVEVTEEEQTARWGIFNTFVTSMEHNDYDTLIDGANLGYYGLNSWYSEAKVELLKRKGVDPATVPLKERNNVPFPVDVPPKFETIEHARKSAATRGRKPLIILHERHIREAIGTNQTILEQWKELNCVLASPHFLNDDYCWLYGSLKKPGTWIITNDQMRDHHFLLLSQQMFIRWRQRHRITYKALHDRVSGTTTIALKFPKPFSVWVQTAADNVETHWHVPFVSGIDILNQATNKTEFTPSDFGLHKDGDDECSSWLCTVKNP
ncbi:hypothetical protein AGDE_03913 [Angomonas deanei]|uniref:Protein-only RNase P, putative n=1 Tax=Angomonas deanei TaxID=59799 RepID=A0A7G2CCR9_9TRYP|nr:hypothetical protein AGDE_03913 [Angomonas deanei]CAD2216513.1 Protein-only RNase P, putative [Angomonas deanei]|eukprot:EPY40015.1 hypothetical protein AGDE_03913 [Angomonas deanei]